MANDGTVKIGVELDQSGLEQDIKKSGDTMRKSIQQVAQETGKSVDEIKAEIKKLAEEFQKSGSSIPQSYKKAYAEMGVDAKSVRQNVAKSVEKIPDDFQDTAKEASEKVKKESDKIPDYYKDAGEKSSSAFGSGLLKLGTVARGALSGGVAVIGGIATAAAGATAGLLALESATEEYRIAQGKLNTAYEAAGYSAETAKTAYTEFYKILGDVDTATEASQLLAKLARSEEDVTKWTRLSAGVWGTFGDSLPIEGLIESANETAKVGVVTGSLADALNWAGINEDDFNKKLEASGNEAERNQLIMDALSSKYDDASDSFYKNNEALIAAREAQDQMNESLAILGETVMNLKNNMVGEFLPGISQVTQAFANMLSGVEGADEQFTIAIGNLIQTLLARLPDFLNFGVQILTSIMQGVVQSIPMLLTAVPQIVQSIFIAFQELAPTLMDVGGQMLSMLADGILENTPVLIDRLPDLILQIIEGIRANLPTVLEVGTEFLTNFIDGVFAELPTFISRLPEIVSAFYDFILSSLPQIVEAGGEILISLASGIIQSLPQLVAQTPAIIAAFVGGIASNIGPIIESGYNLLIQFANAIISNIGYLISQAPQLVQAVVSGIQNNIYQIVQVGRNIIEGLWNGIGNAAGWLKSKIQGLAGDVVQWAKDVLGIKSPSRVFREQIGKNIGLGLAAGIDASKDDALKAADELAKSVYTKSKEWLDKQVKYQEYGLREQLEVWHAIQDQFISSSQQYADAEEEILDIRHQILQENLDLEEEYQKRLSDLSQDIFDSYKLFEEVPEAQEVAGQDLINNLQNQVNSIESFYAALDELYSRGVGKDLVNEIKNMGVDAADQLNALLALSDDQLNEYAELYREKQKLANDLAIEELADLRAQTDDEIQKNLDALEGKFEQESPEVGEALPEGLAKGITNGQKTVIAATVAVATAAIKAAKDTFDMSAATSQITSELERAMPNAAVSVASANARMASVPVPQFSTENAITRAAGMISLSQGTQEREIVLQVNGREFARAVVPDIRAVESQSPAIVYS